MCWHSQGQALLGVPRRCPGEVHWGVSPSPWVSHLLFRPSLSNPAALGRATYRCRFQLQGQTLIQGHTGLGPGRYSPVSPCGVSLATSEPTARLGRLPVLASSSDHPLYFLLFSENPRPRSIHVFSTVPQAAPDRSQDGPRTQPFLQQHNWLLK